uniref:NADPH oxidase organizer 1a n=1 Tax=Salarias fasciatus TaxID=181472 RepID=A0A672FZU8_SALFA
MEAGRYPLSVHVSGVMYKEKKKLFMTSVLWSDQNEIVIYRSFAEFKSMHKQLKKAFPSANKLKKSGRVIPRFQDKTLKQKNPKKGPNKTLAYVKFLQEYCTELLSCDAQVCQSTDLINFFQPKDQDLQPEFAKNSIIIMPSEEENGSRHASSGNVTQPFVTETYRCVATYEAKDTKNKPFKVAVDEKVDVLIKDKAGWWLVEKEDKRMAWFPAPYLEKIDDDDDEDEMDATPERGMLYTAIKSYKATKDDEITVNIGSVVEVLQKSENGWWLIRSNGKVGYIPAMYLKPHSYPHIRLTPNIPDPRASPTSLSPSNLQQQSQLSRSQGNLLQGSPARSPSPFLKPESKQRSQSLDFSEQPLPPPPPPPPSRSAGSFSSDSSDFSFSDELSSSSASSSLTLSPVANDEQPRFSRTPEPMSSSHLSPTSGMEGRLMPSVSDPNLYKGPRSPKVPPRPRAQEILTRCTTITRKNAAKSSQSPTETEILSR